MELKKQILSALGLDKDEEVKLGFQAKTEDGTIIVSTAEELEAGVDASVLTEDGTTIPLPVGTYKLDTGVSFRVETEGVVAEVIESETEEEETPKEEVEAAEEESPAEKADWAKSYEELKDRVDNLEDAIHNLEEQLGDKGAEEMSEEEVVEIAEPSKNPRTKTTKTTEVVEFSVEELKAENEKLKAQLAEQPAAQPLDTNKFSSKTKLDNPLLKEELSKMTKRERILYNIINNK